MVANVEKKKEIVLFDYSFDAYFNYVIEQAVKSKEEAPYHGFLAQRKIKKKERTFYLL